MDKFVGIDLELKAKKMKIVRSQKSTSNLQKNSSMYYTDSLPEGMLMVQGNYINNNSKNSKSIKKLNKTLMDIRNQKEQKWTRNSSQREYYSKLNDEEMHKANTTFLNGMRHNNSQSVIKQRSFNTNFGSTVIINKKSPKKYILKESINGLKYRKCFKGVSYLATGAKNIFNSLDKDSKLNSSTTKAKK